MSTAKMVGLAVGVCIGLIAVAFFAKFWNKDGKMSTKYDEMQERERGRAYKYGFWTMAICDIIFAVIGEIVPVESWALHFSSLIIAAVVFASYCIWKDAYKGLNTDMKRFAIFAVFISIYNLAIGVLSVIRGTLFVNGVVQASIMNFICGFAFAVIGVEIWLKKIADKKEEEED